jgi:hypothetical protein
VCDQTRIQKGSPIVQIDNWRRVQVLRESELICEIWRAYFWSFKRRRHFRGLGGLRRSIWWFIGAYRWFYRVMECGVKPNQSEDCLFANTVYATLSEKINEFPNEESSRWFKFRAGRKQNPDKIASNSNWQLLQGISNWQEKQLPLLYKWRLRLPTLVPAWW